MSSFGKSKGNKYYKGVSTDTAWNHDILWKARVRSENKAAGLQKHDNVPSFYQNEEARPGSGVLAATAQRHMTAADRAKLKSLRTLLAAEMAKTNKLQLKLNALLEIVLQREHQFVKKRGKTKMLRNFSKTLGSSGKTELIHALKTPIRRRKI